MIIPTSKNDTYAIELSDVNMTYGTAVKTQVLFDVDLKVRKGEFCSIVGQSGSGKSTLLNIIGTLQSPTSGKVVLNGADISSLDRNALSLLRNDMIGFVFQNHLLIPEFSAIENVLLPHRIGGRIVDRKTMKRAEELLELTDTFEVRNNRAFNMSGGQQQRVAIARALMNQPMLLLADEPTGNLDTDSTEKVYGLLRDINIRLGTTFVIITHDRRIADKTDRIIEIKDGRIGLDIRNDSIS